MECLILKTQEEPLEHKVQEESETDYYSEETRDLKSIVGRPPFTQFFHQLFEEIREQAAKEFVSNENNPYFCPGIIEFLFL